MWTLACFFLAVFLFLQERRAKKEEAPPSNGKHEEKLRRILKIGEAILTLGLLYITSALLELLGIFLKEKPAAQIVFPSTPLEIFFCIATLFCAAFFEEVLYRGYLPFAVAGIREKGEAKGRSYRLRKLVLEAVAVLLFAFGHLQNGWLAVLNAFFAGIVLRRCALKTKHIWAGFAAHFIYNALKMAALAATVQ